MSRAGRLLLIDVGNTRVKWAWQSGKSKELHGQGAQALGDGLVSLPFLRQTGEVAGVLACNVGGQQRERELAAAVRARLGAELTIAQPRRTACGVTAAYARVANLGADRWAALLGAHALGPHACCIVDAGSAITMDFLLPDGRHLGGYIAPGRDMSLGAIAQGAAELGPRLRRDFSAPQDIAPGTDSAEAVAKGVLASQIGLIRLGVEMLEERARTPAHLVLTGGGAETLIATARLPQAQWAPDLVLRGLAALAVELQFWPE